MPDDVGRVLLQGTRAPATVPAHIFAAAVDAFVTGRSSTVHRGMAAALENLIDLERSRGAFEVSLDTPTLAFAIVRVSEGFLYSGVIADRAPDIGRAVTVIEALLRGLDLVNRAPVPS
jgi:Tetracyclin repressor-like, C-terminal domain